MSHLASIKGIVTVGGAVVLLRNARDEWELPGGRPEWGETHREALARELNEELGIEVEIDPHPLDRYDFSPVPGRTVTVITYGCGDHPADQPLVVSDEHLAVKTFSPFDASRLPDLPEGYRASIRERFGL